MRYQSPSNKNLSQLVSSIHLRFFNLFFATGMFWFLFWFLPVYRCFVYSGTSWLNSHRLPCLWKCISCTLITFRHHQTNICPCSVGLRLSNTYKTCGKSPNSFFFSESIQSVLICWEIKENVTREHMKTLTSLRFVCLLAPPRDYNIYSTMYLYNPADRSHYKPESPALAIHICPSLCPSRLYLQTHAQSCRTQLHKPQAGGII